MKRETSGGESIRLTNRTAKALREQARRQQFALRLTAVIETVALAALSVYLGMRRILYVPALLLLAIGLDALLLFCARCRYVQLTGQAICTEAAARIMRGEKAEQQRIIRAQRDLAQIKRDLAQPSAGRAEDEEDEDLFGGTPQAKASVSAVTARTSAETARMSAETASVIAETARMRAVTTRVNPVSASPEPDGEGDQPARRRRRQARLQVISGEEAR